MVEFIRKAALKRPHSKRFANAKALDAARQLLECGRFSTAFALTFKIQTGTPT
jgi:hypothetical protein